MEDDVTVRNKVAPRWKRRFLGWTAFLCLFGCYASTVTLDHPSNDVISACLGAWRIAETHTPWLDDADVDAIPRQHHISLWVGEAENGHTAVFRSPGAIASGVPAYLVAQQGRSPQDFDVLPGAITAALLAALSMLLLWIALHRYLPARESTVSVATLALTTPIWSVDADGLWTHAVTVLGLAGMVWAASRERWWLAGIFGGVGLWGRLHLALIVAILGLGLALWRRKPSIAVSVGAASGIFMLLAAWWAHWMYGTWNPAGPYPTVTAYAQNAAERAGGGGWFDQLVNEAGLLISPDRGLLVWTPALIILLPAVGRSWNQLPDWSRVLVIGGLAYAVVQGLLNGFAGGSGFFGYRLTLETLVCVFPAYALSAAQAGPIARRLLGPVLALQFSAISFGAVSNAFLLPDDQAWSDNSLWLALRHEPELWAWVILMLVIGTLAGAAWRDRDWGFSAPISGEELEQEPGRDGARTRA